MVFQITSLTFFISTFMQAQIKENNKAPRHWRLWVEFTVTCEYSTQKASNAANVSIWRRHHGRSCTLMASFHAIIVCLVRMRYGEIYFTILNISRLKQNGHHCANEIFELIFLLFKFCIDDLKPPPQNSELRHNLLNPKMYQEVMQTLQFKIDTE